MKFCTVALQITEFDKLTLPCMAQVISGNEDNIFADVCFLHRQNISSDQTIVIKMWVIVSKQSIAFQSIF